MHLSAWAAGGATGARSLSVEGATSVSTIGSEVVATSSEAQAPVSTSGMAVGARRAEGQAHASTSGSAIMSCKECRGAGSVCQHGRRSVSKKCGGSQVIAFSSHQQYTFSFLFQITHILYIVSLLPQVPQLQ